MRELKSLPSSIAIDTGPLLLPITREPGWDKIRRLLVMHERGVVTLYVGLFNISELSYAMYRLGFDEETALKYSILVSERLNIIKDVQYATWMSKIRIRSYEHGYNIPWGDISSAAVALSLDIPVVALDEDKHFNYIALLGSELGRTIRIIRVVRDLKV